MKVIPFSTAHITFEIGEVFVLNKQEDIMENTASSSS
jgi:hypothetical protein